MCPFTSHAWEHRSTMNQSMLTLTWQSVSSDLLHLGIAYVLALPIGLNREREDRSAGLRTFPIVAVAACGFTMLPRPYLVPPPTATHASCRG